MTQTQARPTESHTFERGGRTVVTGRRLGQVAGRKPAGVTGSQWSAATAVVLDYLVLGPDASAAGVAPEASVASPSGPEFAVVFTDLAGPGTPAARTARMVTAVCDALALPVLRIAAPGLRAATHGRQIVEYVLDARAFAGVSGSALAPTDAASPADFAGSAADPSGYRDIMGRLPDGRTGYVNDLAAVARASAVEAYALRQVTDPIIRSLRIRWADGSAEGWAWLHLREGGYVLERVRVEEHRVWCGVPADRLAEDLAGAAIGQRLKMRHTDEPELISEADLARELDALRARSAEMRDATLPPVEIVD